MRYTNTKDFYKFLDSRTKEEIKLLAEKIAVIKTAERDVDVRFIIKILSVCLVFLFIVATIITFYPNSILVIKYSMPILTILLSSLRDI